MRKTVVSMMSAALAVLALALPAVAQTTLLSENFDGVNAPNLPAGWAVSQVAGEAPNRGWTTQSVLVEPAATAHSAPNVARFQSYYISPGGAYRLYRTLPARLGCALTGTVTLSFWMYHDPDYSTAPYDRIQVQYSTDGGTTWNNVAGAVFDRYAASAAWAQHAVDLTALALGQTDFRVGFLGISEFGNDIYIDNVSLTTSAAVPVLSYAYSLVVDECPSGGPYGGDSVIDPGETVHITPSLANAGTAVGANFTGTLTTTTPGVTIPTNTVTWPAIPAGSVGTAADSAFVVEVALSVPCTTLLQFHLAISNGACSFEDDFTLRVGVHDNIPVSAYQMSFDSVTPPALPAGWATQVVVPPGEGTYPEWFTNAGTHQPPGQAMPPPQPVDAKCAYFNSYDTPRGSQARLYMTTPVNFSAYVEGGVSFQMWHNTSGLGYYTDGVQLQYSLDGINWTDLGAPVYLYSPVGGWWPASNFLPYSLDHQPALYFALLGWSDGGLADCHITNFGVIGTNYSPCHPCAPACTIDSCTATAPVLGFAGHAVSFTGGVDYTGCTGTPTWSWTFGDGGTSTDQNPTHTYAAPGDYTYSLTVTIDGVSCTTGGTIPICTLTCSASATPTWGFAPLTVNFSGGATIGGCTLPTRQVITYLWTFGDGTTSTDQNPAHTYSATGTYNWTFTATVDGVTCQSQGSVQVCTLTCTASASPTSGYAPLTVNFTSSATISGCTPPTRQAITYLWDFGDGAASTDQNPVHTYTANGTYNWTCTITVDGTPCVQSGSVAVTSFDMHFYDDYRTGWLCVDSTSGYWVYWTFTNPYFGIYSGRSIVAYGPGTFRLVVGDYPGVKLTVKVAMHQAHAELWLDPLTKAGMIKDMNTQDDPPECPPLTGEPTGKKR